MNAKDAERSVLRSYMSGLTRKAFGDLRLAWVQPQIWSGLFDQPIK